MCQKIAVANGFKRRARRDGAQNRSFSSGWETGRCVESSNCKKNEWMIDPSINGNIETKISSTMACPWLDIDPVKLTRISTKSQLSWAQMFLHTDGGCTHATTSLQELWKQLMQRARADGRGQQRSALEPRVSQANSSEVFSVNLMQSLNHDHDIYSIYGVPGQKVRILWCRLK